MPSNCGAIPTQCSNSSVSDSDSIIHRRLGLLLNNALSCCVSTDSKTSVAAPWILDEVDWNGMKALTSRKEYDIESTLQPIIIATVSMEDTRVDPDIRIHVEQCMCEDPKLSKWDTKKS